MREAVGRGEVQEDPLQIPEYEDVEAESSEEESDSESDVDGQMADYDAD